MSLVDLIAECFTEKTLHIRGLKALEGIKKIEAHRMSQKINRNHYGVEVTVALCLQSSIKAGTTLFNFSTIL